jgi:GAF domain-containing protein
VVSAAATGDTGWDPGGDPSTLLASIAESLQAEEGYPATAEQVLACALRTLGADHAGITLVRTTGSGTPAGLSTLAATDSLVEKAERLQTDLGEGPCMERAWPQQTVVCEDLGNEGRWPRWAAEVSGLGLGSLLGVELTARGRRFGTLSLYCVRPRCFDAEQIAFAHLFARHAAVALAAARHEETLHEAIDARTLIGQAQGILMERFGIDADKAFEVLRRYSQDRNVKLRGVAEQIVESRKLPR